VRYTYGSHTKEIIAFSVNLNFFEINIQYNLKCSIHTIGPIIEGNINQLLI